MGLKYVSGLRTGLWWICKRREKKGKYRVSLKTPFILQTKTILMQLFHILILKTFLCGKVNKRVNFKFQKGILENMKVFLRIKEKLFCIICNREEIVAICLLLLVVRHRVEATRGEACPFYLRDQLLMSI